MILPPPGAPHGRQDQLGHPGKAKDVHLELAPALGQVHLFQRPEGPVAGVVDQDVYPPAFCRLLPETPTAGSSRNIREVPAAGFAA